MDNFMVMMIPILSVVGSFVMIICIVWLVTRARQRAAQYRADVQMKLIDKFASSAEFAKFLESPAGQQFLEQPRRSIRDRAAGGITGALVCTFIGLAFVGCAFMTHDEGFLIPGFILIGIGIALFISAAISWKMLRQIEAKEPRTTP